MQKMKKISNKCKLKLKKVPESVKSSKNLEKVPKIAKGTRKRDK